MSKDLCDEADQFASERLAECTRRFTQEPAIEHARRVCQMVSGSSHGNERTKCIALLHDVVEDTPTTLQEIRDVFGLNIAMGVLDLTNATVGNRAQRHALNVRRLIQAPGYIQSIKCCDVIDNVPSIVEHDPDFAKLFVREKWSILAGFTRADARLLSKARKIVKEGMAHLGVDVE